MSESKHDKGPWRWSRTYEIGDSEHWCLENDESAAQKQTIDAALILRLNRDDWLGEPFLNNPNARLIAAAPSMRALLEKALPLIEEEADRRDEAYTTGGAPLGPYFTEMRDLADEIAAILR